ncbi:MAG: RDD family protein [Flavobacteriaceae bacterium]
MTRLEHLKFCNVCRHQKKDTNLGVVCSYSGAIATFEDNCELFEQDDLRRNKLRERKSIYYLESKLAGQGKRLANYLIDQLFLIGLALIIGSILGAVLVYRYPNYIYLLDEENRLRDYALGFVIALIYYSFFEGITGRSLGKFFTKTKVITEEGKKPNFSTILIRSLCRSIPFNHFSFLSHDAVGWHDKFSKTRVVEID